ncbi:MAG: L-rhamnose/proton symporter RhaT [Candidatus Acidiferrales bacterium]
MNSQAEMGALLVVLGGVLQGAFAVPMKGMGRWRWENTWLIYSIFAMVLFPLAVGVYTVPHLFSVFANTPAATVAAVALFGFGWGCGSTLFGLGISRVGMALGFAIILGMTSPLGSLLPLAILHPDQLWKPKGQHLIAGLGIVIVGIILCAIAGAKREREQKTAAAGAPEAGRERSSFLAGLLICIASGILSPMLNFSFTFGTKLTDAAKLAGAGATSSANAIWVPALGAGFLANAAYCLYLLSRNRTWGEFRGEGIPYGYWLGAVAMGLMWYGGICVYGLGAAAMGSLGGIIGWPAFMATMIVTANVLGAITGEWKGASGASRAYSWLGIAVLVAAIYVISRAA